MIARKTRQWVELVCRKLLPAVHVFQLLPHIAGIYERKPHILSYFAVLSLARLTVLGH